MSKRISVMALKPFARYAVIFEHSDGTMSDQPAMPFYSRSHALLWARQMSQQMSNCRMYVYRLRVWRKVDERPVAILSRASALDETQQPTEEDRT